MKPSKNVQNKLAENAYNTSGHTSEQSHRREIGVVGKTFGTRNRSLQVASVSSNYTTNSAVGSGRR